MGRGVKLTYLVHSNYGVVEMVLTVKQRCQLVLGFVAHWSQ